MTIEVSRDLWRLAPGQQLVHRGWDGEYVLYNDLSGDTHLVDENALLLLKALQRAPAAEAALAEQVFGSAAGAETLAPLLAGLARLSLIESIPC